MQAQSDNQILAVRVACSDAQNVSARATGIRFLVILEYGCWSTTQILNYTKLNQSPTSEIRITWNDLPVDFGAVSTGFIFEAPWDETSDFGVLECALHAR